MKKLFILSLAVLAISGATFAQAPYQVGPGPGQFIDRGPICPGGATVFLNNAPNQSNGIFSDSVCNFCGGTAQVLAQPFTLGGLGANINELVLFGGFFPGNVPPAAEMFRVLIHSDAGGVPGAAISDETVAPTSSTQTGVILFGVNEVEVVLNLTDVPLAPGTYWLEVYDDVINPDDWFWEVGNLDPGQPVGSAFAFEAPGVIWNSDTVNSFGTTICGDPIIPVDLTAFEVE